MGDARDDPPSEHFGDHPHGSYWTARTPDAETTAKKRPWPSSEVWTPQHPYPIRMFAEIGCDFALWGPIHERPPTTSRAVAGPLEEQLPISVSVRERLVAWASDHERYDGGDRTVPMEDFDERGFLMSRELQRELGNMYSVEYLFHFSETDREALLRSVAGEPLPGWRCQ